MLETEILVGIERPCIVVKGFDVFAEDAIVIVRACSRRFLGWLDFDPD
jgi:hypothetical protein